MAALEDLPDKLLNHIGSKVSISNHLRLGAALGYTEGKPVRLGAAERYKQKHGRKLLKKGGPTPPPSPERQAGEKKIRRLIKPPSSIEETSYDPDL